MTHSFHPHPPTSPEVGFFTPIYPLQPLRRGDPCGRPRSPSVRGGVLTAPVCRASCAPRRAGCPHPAARPCTALPAGHTGPALQKNCVPSRADRVVRPYNSATGGAMWASPPTRNMKLQQNGASRTPPPTKFYHSSVRRGRRPCPPAKFVPSSMQKPCHCEGAPRPWQSVLLSPSPRKKRGRLSASSFLHN